MESTFSTKSIQPMKKASKRFIVLLISLMFVLSTPNWDISVNIGDFNIGRGNTLTNS